MCEGEGEGAVRINLSLISNTNKGQKLYNGVHYSAGNSFTVPCTTVYIHYFKHGSLVHSRGYTVHMFNTLEELETSKKRLLLYNFSSKDLK